MGICPVARIAPPERGKLRKLKNWRKTEMITVGIDPGLTGAIAFLRDGEFLTVEDMPTTEKVGGKGRMVDCGELAALLKGPNEARHWLEMQSARPGQGVSSVFSLGRSYGAIEAILHDRRIEYIFPPNWKRYFGLIGEPKDAARDLAILRHPEARQFLKRKKDHGRADAILIAEYGAAQMPKPAAHIAAGYS